MVSLVGYQASSNGSIRMEGLALIVALIFLTVISSGVLCWIASFILPKWLTQILCICTLFLAAWWILLPIGFARLFSVPTLLIAVYVYNK